jgi:hypothetical protein
MSPRVKKIHEKGGHFSALAKRQFWTPAVQSGVL